MAKYVQEELLAIHQQRQRTAHWARGPAVLMLTSSPLLLELRRLSLLVLPNPTDSPNLQLSHLFRLRAGLTSMMSSTCWLTH